MIYAASIEFPPWLLALGGIFGTLAVLGAAYAVIRSSVQTRTAQLWKEQAEAYEKRVAQVERANAHLEAELGKSNTKIESQARELETLRSTVSAGPAIASLDKHLAGQHNEILGMQDRILDAIEDLTAAFTGNEKPKPRRKRARPAPEAT